jgi:hypothetical protein
METHLTKFSNVNGEVYFDAVLDYDMQPIFNGTPEKTREFLETKVLSLDHMVCVGKTMELLTIPQYLER